jgi:hypothetical protein
LPRPSGDQPHRSKLIQEVSVGGEGVRFDANLQRPSSFRVSQARPDEIPPGQTKFVYTGGKPVMLANFAGALAGLSLASV